MPALNPRSKLNLDALPQRHEFNSYEEWLVAVLDASKPKPPQELLDDPSVFVLQFPPDLQPVYDAIWSDWGIKHVVVPTGRAAGKSVSISMIILDVCMQKRTNVVCYRETKQALSDSIYKVMSDCIIAEGLLGTHFELIPSKSMIREVNTGSEITFRSIQTSFSSRQKGAAIIDIAFVDECEEISMLSLEKFIPSLRGGVWHPTSLILWAGNIETNEDPFVQYFLSGSPPPGTVICRSSLYANPWADPSNMIAAERMKRDDPVLWQHVYGGTARDFSHLAVFNNWTRTKSSKWDDLAKERGIEPMLGLDFGFVENPMRYVCLRVFEPEKVMYWQYEIDGVRVPTTMLGSWLGGKPEHKGHKWEYFADYDLALHDPRNAPIQQLARERRFTIWGDSAETEWCWNLKGQGFNIEPVRKDLIEDGINYLMGYKNVVHERCSATYQDFARYQLVEDPKTGKAKVPSKPEDKNNDSIDAGRYATREHRRKKHEARSKGIASSVSNAPSLVVERDIRGRVKQGVAKPKQGTQSRNANVHVAF